MSLFNNLSSEGFEDNQDRLGGFSVLETDIYAGKIKVAYAGQSPGGAQCVTLLIDFAGREHRETIYITTKKGDNFFMNKESPPKKVALPGFTTIDDICQVTTGNPLSMQKAEDKIVNVYDPEAKKELPKSVPVLVDLVGKDVLLAIQKSTVDKTVKQGDAYVPTGESRDENTIEKVFHSELRITVVEAKDADKNNRAPVAGFIDAWVERNKGKTRDKRQDRSGDSVRTGRPSAAANSGPPQATAGAPVRKSLFGATAAAA